MASCNYEPNLDDLASRGEVAVESETAYQMADIQLVNGLITAIIITDADKLATLKASTLSAIKAKLADTDYKCLKYVDGELTEAEYADVKVERHNLRVAYNAIQATTTLAELNTIEVIW